MKLAEVVRELDLEVRTASSESDREVHGGYVSDLMSDVIANASEGDLWVTLQIHQNTVAVACLKELAGIVLVNGREPEEVTVEKAEAENVTILVSRLPAFDLVGRLYELGIRGAGVKASSGLTGDA